MYYNKNTFVHHSFGEETFKKTLVYEERPIEIKKAMTYIYKAQISEIVTKDGIIYPLPSQNSIVKISFSH
jgi:hypothetical protein